MNAQSVCGNCMSGHIYVYIWCIQVLCVHVPVGKTFSYWLDLGAWSSSSLTSLGLLDLVGDIFL